MSPRSEDLPEPELLEWLLQDTAGTLALPVWSDHVGSRGTRYGQFSLLPARDALIPPPEAWVSIAPSIA